MWVRVATYVNGGGTAEERTETARWIAAEPGRAAAVEQLREAWADGQRSIVADAGSLAEGVDVVAAWDALKGRIGLEGVSRIRAGLGSRTGFNAERSARETRGFDGRGALWRAGTLRGGTRKPWPSLGLLGFLVGFALFTFGMRWVVSGGSHGALGITRTYQTAIGQRATLTLNEGTRVMLGPRTRLRLVQFGRDQRVVELDGEGYFNVVDAHGAPFVVRTGSTVTRVLGTTFVVQHYPVDPAVRVTVMAGKVNVSANNTNQPTITITAGNVGEVGDSIAVVHTADDQHAEAWWTQDEVVFNHAPVTKVLAALTHWYGYAFVSPDSSLVRQDVTVWLSTQSSAKALSALEQVLNVSLTITGDTITLLPRHGRETREGPRSKAYDVWTPSREVGR